MNTIDTISPNTPAWAKKLMIGVACAFALYLAAPFTVVPTGNRGILTTFGNPSDTVYETGLHFRIPFVQKMHLMNVQIQAAEGEGDAASKDMQSVQTRVAINYHLDPKSAVDAYINIGSSTDIVAQRIIIPATHESVKAITARFTAEELITQRTAVRDAISALLREKMARHGLVLDEFNLVNFAFSKSFSDAIENKVKAEQQKQQAERDLQRLQVEAQQKIVAVIRRLEESGEIVLSRGGEEEMLV